MPETTSFSEQQTAFANGPCVQSPVPASVHGMPSTVGAGATVTSNLINSDGYQKIAAAVTSTQAGALTVKRYLDDAGTILQTQFTATTLTANTAALNNVNDGLPFACFTISVSNTSGVSATLSNFFALLQSQ